MGQKKPVNNIDEGTLNKFSEMLKNMKSHYLQLTVYTNREDENNWEANGTMKIGSSLDGEHWGELAMSVKGYDVNSDSALATVMISLNNYINSPEFLFEMGTRMEKSMEEEAKLPWILATEPNE